MTESLVLVILVPIIAGILSLLVGLWRANSGWTIALLASVVQFGLAGSVLATVARDGRQTYELGGFAPPAGIELVADGLSAIVITLVAAVAVAVLVYARRVGPRGNAFYSLYLLLVGGLAGVTMTGDLFNMYVFLEISGLAAYALVASGDSPGGAVAGLKYLVLGTIGASLFLLGVGYAYVATGTLNMVDLSTSLAAAGYDSRVVLGAFGLVVTGLLVKVALFPVHSWQPGAYASAPRSISVLISALVSTVAAYAVARVCFTVFTVDFFAAVPVARRALLTVAAVSIVAGSVLAILQRDLRRMLAYSSVAQFGMVVAAVALLSETAAVGAVIHLVGHAVLKGGLFAAVGLVSLRTGATTLAEYDGLADREPVCAAAIATLGLILVGVPPGVGFVGKWYIVLGALQTGAWSVALVILLSTVLTLAYVARVVERMYLTPADTSSTEHEAPENGALDDGVDDVESPSPATEDASVAPGMVAVVLVATIAALALGLLGTTIEGLLDPTLLEVFGR